MAIPHNTIKDDERLKMSEQIREFFAGGGRIEAVPAYDQPKDVELKGDMMKVYSFIKSYYEARGRIPPRKRISAETGLSAKKLGSYLLALDKLGRVSCNKHGVIVGVN